MKFKKIYIEITNFCNKNCSFCSKTNRNLKEMSLEDFYNVINEVKKYTDYIYLHVKGEPLLHSKFDEILNICDLNNIKVNITTNGSLIKKREEILKKHNCIRQMNISIHSITNKEEVNDILTSLISIRKDNNFYVVYRYWTLPFNYKISDNMIMKEIIKYYKFDNNMINKINGEDNIKIDKYTYINKASEFVWPSLQNDYYNEEGYCLGLKSHIAILSDGTVVPCCLDGEGIIKLGNIFEKSLDEILSCKYTIDIINGFKNNKKICELCKHCSFKS